MTDPLVTTATAHDEAAWFGLRREIHDCPVVARFTVNGEPMSKARARVVNGRAFTPERTRRAEEVVGWSFRASARGWTPRKDRSYGVVALFFAKTRQRRDVDNMLKLILDGLNGIAWDDDTQVVEVSGRKSFVDDADHARTEVLVYEVPHDPGRQAQCQWCGKAFPTYDSLIGKIKFCSKDCRQEKARSGRQRTCQTCGEVFESSHARKFCSPGCQRTGGRVVQPCEHCGADVERFKSWSKNGRPFCNEECRQAYWRAHRSKAAKGVCGACGGPTSKKTYSRCRACAIAGREITGVSR